MASTSSAPATTAPGCSAAAANGSTRAAQRGADDHAQDAGHRSGDVQDPGGRGGRPVLSHAVPVLPVGVPLVAVPLGSRARGSPDAPDSATPSADLLTSASARLPMSTQRCEPGSGPTSAAGADDGSAVVGRSASSFRPMCGGARCLGWRRGGKRGPGGLGRTASPGAARPRLRGTGSWSRCSPRRRSRERPASGPALVPGELRGDRRAGVHAAVAAHAPAGDARARLRYLVGVDVASVVGTRGRTCRLRLDGLPAAARLRVVPVGVGSRAVDRVGDRTGVLTPWARRRPRHDRRRGLRPGGPGVPGGPGSLGAAAGDGAPA